MDVKEQRKISLRYRGIEGDTIHFWVAILAYKRESLFFFLSSRLRDTESSAANSSCRINGTRSSSPSPIPIFFVIVQSFCPLPLCFSLLKRYRENVAFSMCLPSAEEMFRRFIKLESTDFSFCSPVHDLLPTLLDRLYARMFDGLLAASRINARRGYK